MRIYELSKQLGIPAKELLDHLKLKGIVAKSHMSAIDEATIALLLKKFQPSPEPAKAAPKTSHPKKTQERNEPMQKETVKPIVQPKQTPQQSSVLRPSLKQSVQPAQPVKPVSAEPKVPEFIVLEPMTVSDAAIALAKPVNDIILTLLTWKVIAAKNKLLTEDIVERLARHYQVAVQKKRAAVQEQQSRVAHVGIGELKERLPVIVVVGHVDHGKTTLLDFIRKTRVVSKEKGGITQHIGAYEASTSHGNLVFLDTPGHEAFPKIRQRGIKVADIGILVIAADDGIMPQTVEAIKLLKKMEVPIIVAMNKVDKVEPVRLEVVKRQLAEHDLLPEEWGGNVICMPISALTGKGVNEFLEMIALQAQMLELRASQEGFAHCYVLESSLERGRGVVATLICQNGTLSVGDYFVCGKTFGRVSSIKNSAGVGLRQVGPSIPVLVAGFNELPDAGDLFKAVPKEDVRKDQQQDRNMALSVRAAQENTINLIIKVDTNSSKEALLDAINSLSAKADIGFNIILAGVGAISEGDIELAYSTNSLIIGLHTKAESNAIALAQRKGVSIELYDIIYKLLESLKERSTKDKEVEKVKTKIGQAIVRRVFDIKGVGVVAGSYIQEGRFAKEGTVIGWRGSRKLGEGKITSLQRDKKSVKEVHAGFECGFVIEGITDWHEDDRAECFLELPKK